jgi:hypothetical protein
MKSITDTNRGKTDSGFLGLLRIVSPIAVVAGAAGSLALMLHDHLHSPLVLLVLFTGWVLLPFMALLLAFLVFSKRWSVIPQTALYVVMLLLQLASLASYGFVVFGPPRAQQTFGFLAIPLGSWVLISIAAAIAAIARSH